MTIRAKNELTSSGYAKDYDAIVTVRLNERLVSFALEYERTPKGFDIVCTCPAPL